MLEKMNNNNERADALRNSALGEGSALEPNMDDHVVSRFPS